VTRNTDIELVVRSLIELGQSLSDGQRDQVEVVSRLVDAIDNLTLAHAALRDELALLRAEAGSRDGSHATGAVIDADDADGHRALREKARQVRLHARDTAGRAAS
jgi:hypothetical protein